MEEKSELVGESLDGIFPGLVLEMREQLEEHLFFTEEEATEGLPKKRVSGRESGERDLFIREFVALVDSSWSIITTSAILSRRRSWRTLDEHVEVSAVVLQSLHFVHIPIEGFLR